MKTEDKSPPRMALRFLEWFCPTSLYESIEGDLFQQFEEDVKANSLAIAKRKFLLNVIKFFRPEIVLRNRFSFQLIQRHSRTSNGSFSKPIARNVYRLRKDYYRV